MYAATNVPEPPPPPSAHSLLDKIVIVFVVTVLCIFRSCNLFRFL